MNNCPIALTFCTEVQSQWKNICLGSYDTYGQIMTIKGKYDQIMVINATLDQI